MQRKMGTVRTQTYGSKRRKKSAGVQCRETLDAPVPGETTATRTRFRSNRCGPQEHLVDG